MVLHQPQQADSLPAAAVLEPAGQAAHQAQAAKGRCVALWMAAPASGQGKTLVMAALARWRQRQGRRVRMCQCGPDFLDPRWHELACGAPVHHLDFSSGKAVYRLFLGDLE